MVFRLQSLSTSRETNFKGEVMKKLFLCIVSLVTISFLNALAGESQNIGINETRHYISESGDCVRLGPLNLENFNS
jgi:hypothetical protein